MFVEFSINVTPTPAIRGFFTRLHIVKLIELTISSMSFLVTFTSSSQVGSSRPLIVVDVGNSRMKLALFRDWGQIRSGNNLPAPELKLTTSSVDPHFNWLELKSAIGEFSNPISIASSVNPRGWNRLLGEWPVDEWPVPQLILDRQSLPLENATLEPNRVGMDRLLKAVAGNRLRMAGHPLIIVDCGTASTVDWIDSSGIFRGGAILPGMELFARALHDYTAQLPKLNLAEFPSVVRPVGRNTVEALQSGVYWGQVGAIHEVIAQILKENVIAVPEILLTGGLSDLVERHFRYPFVACPLLTLQGLAITACSIYADDELSSSDSIGI